MISLCLGIPMLVTGLLVLTKGQTYPYLGKRHIRGLRARLIGFLLMLPLIIEATLLALQNDGKLRISESRFLMCDVDLLILLSVFLLVAALTLTSPRQKNKAKDGIFLPDLLTVDEAADYLHVPPENVQQLVQSGQLTATKERNSSRISRDELIRFLK